MKDSRSASQSPTLNAYKAGSDLGPSPRGSHGKSKSSSDLMDVGADGEEVNGDANGGKEGDADPTADAELFDALGAVEAMDEEWLKTPERYAQSRLAPW